MQYGKFKGKRPQGSATARVTRPRSVTPQRRPFFSDDIRPTTRSRYGSSSSPSWAVWAISCGAVALFFLLGILLW